MASRWRRVASTPSTRLEVRKQTLTHHVASKGLAQTGQCQKMLEGPWGGAIGSSSEQKLPQPGQGADRKTSGARHLRGNDAVTDETRGRSRDHDDGAVDAT